MQSEIVFYIKEHSIGGRGRIKLLHVEYLDYWKLYRGLARLAVDIPLAVQYHLDIGHCITINVFELNNRSLTDDDFIKAGFVKDAEFDHMFVEYEESQK
jgi:hypothetical protein